MHVHPGMFLLDPHTGWDGRYHCNYLVTNLDNGKFYKGKRTSKKQHTSYLGSGNVIKNAVKKYGRKAFKKELISWHFSVGENIIAEIAYVTQEDVDNPECYNLTLGGEGASLQMPEVKEKIRAVNSKPKSLEHRRNLSKGIQKWHDENEVSLETREKIRRSQLGVKDGPQSEEQKRKTSDAVKYSEKAIAYRKTRIGHKDSQETIDKRVASLSASSLWAAANAAKRVPKGPMVSKHKENNAKHLESLNSVKLTCKFCGKEVDKGNYAKWHGEKCKLNI